jgi:hypothetical protein
LSKVIYVLLSISDYAFGLQLRQIARRCVAVCFSGLLG